MSETGLIRSKNVLAFSSLVEAGTGLALMIDPGIVTLLLLGGRVSGAATVVGRVAGVALLSLGMACWPGLNTAGARPGGHRALLTYNLLVTLLLLSVGLGSAATRGMLLWPAVVLHAVLTVLIAGAAARSRLARM